MTTDIVQALSDMDHGEAAAPTIWTSPSADCGLNEFEIAAGGYYLDHDACNESRFGRQVLS